MSLETKAGRVLNNISTVPESSLVSDRWVVDTLRNNALANQYTDEEPYFQIEGLSVKNPYNSCTVSIVVDERVPLVEIARDFSNAVRFMGLPIHMGGREDLLDSAIDTEAEITGFTNDFGDPMTPEYKERFEERKKRLAKASQMEIIEHIEYGEEWMRAGDEIEKQDWYFEFLREGRFVGMQSNLNFFCGVNRSLVLKAYGLYLADRKKATLT